MTTVNKALIPSKQMEAAQTTQYTVPTTAKAIIDTFTATNTSASAAIISVNLVISGGVAGVTNELVDDRQIEAGESWSFPELVGHVIEPSGFISTAGTAAAITIRCSGREIS